MASLKTNFYFEVFKQQKKLCFELSHRSNIAKRHWNLLKITAIFRTSPMKKTMFSSSSYQWEDFFVNLLADRKAVDSTPKSSVLARGTNQASIFSPCIRCK